MLLLSLAKSLFPAHKSISLRAVLGTGANMTRSHGTHADNRPIAQGIVVLRSHKSQLNQTANHFCRAEIFFQRL
jgi:hypothetical protein